MRIIKKTNSHQTAVFVVLEPEMVDLNGDIVDIDVITEAAHEFMLNLSKKKVNFDHLKNTDTQEASFVESYILPSDINWVDQDGKPYTIPTGSWLIWIKFSDNLWKDLLDGKFTWISMEWSWTHL